MILISHRGNINGAIPDRENSPAYIDEALNANYFVEIDVWYDKGWWLGHDKPQYKMPKAFFGSESCHFYFHAKNSDALERLCRVPGSLHTFWHQEDDYTLTSWGLIWVYPGKTLLKGSICVLPEWGFTGNIKECYGVCSDNIANVEEELL